MRRTVTIVRPGKDDPFGDQIEPAQEFSDRVPWIIGTSSSNDTADGQRNRIDSRVSAYPLGETLARADDLVRIDNRLWQVDGHPARAESPFTGRLAGYVVSLKSFEG